MFKNQDKKFELHNVINTILSAFLLATAGFLYSANNQLIVITERMQSFEKSLETMDKKIDENINRLNNNELRNRR